jgi:uncharacterized protein (TIGR03084 family)
MIDDQPTPDWAQACAGLAQEAAALRELIEAQPADPLRVTPFQGWRVRDTIAHMVLIDSLAFRSLTDSEAFDLERERFGQGTAPSEPSGPPDHVFRRIADYEESRLGVLSWRQLLSAWTAGLEDLHAAFLARAPDDRTPWFASQMAVKTLLAARQMEVWGYGQDVFDLYGMTRRETDRLKAVADFAVRTFGFAFANRGIQIPQERPYINLAAPSGGRWTWNSPQASSRIEGEAVDFCLVATQRRHLDDTGLQATGETARTWMTIAQCIAGPPIDGPAPGLRLRRF